MPTVNTTVYSNEWTQSIWHLRLKCDYTVNTSNPTVTVIPTVSLQCKADTTGTSTGIYYQIFGQLTGDSAVSSAVTAGNISGTSWQTYPTTVQTSKTYTRNHSEYTVSLSFWGKMRWYDQSSLSPIADTKTVSITIPALPSYTVSYNANGGSGAPSYQTKWYDEDLTLSSVTPSRTGYTFQGWATSANGSVEYQSGGTYKVNSNRTLYAVWQVNAPTVAPTIGTNTRNSDTQNTISWTYSTTVPPITKFYIERSANDQAWVQIATVGETVRSYVDTSTSANKYYRYRVKCGNAMGQSGYSSASNYTYNTPAAPTNLTATRDANLKVNLAWTQNGITQTEVIVEDSHDGSTWDTVDTISGTLSAYTVESPDPYALYYRVTNRSNRTTVLTSAPSNTSEPLPLSAPLAPTLKSPVSGQVFNMPSSVTVSWTHNPTDGTAQTQAEIAYSSNGGTSWAYNHVTTANSAVISYLSNYPVNSVITWMVRTKGEYSEYGVFSETRIFYLRQAPSVSITSPASSDGGSITDVPVQLGFTYTDNSGSFASAEATITNANSETVWSGTPTWSVSGSSYSFNVPVAEFVPPNDSSYTLTITANSTSGLSTTATRIFTTDYIEPNPPVLEYAINDADCSVTLNVTEGTGSSSIATVAVGVFRIDKSGESPIAAVMNSGDSVTDYLPPLDQEFTYRAVAYTVNGLTSQTLETVKVDSDGRCMFNWGDGNAQSAGFNMDVTWKTSIEHERSLYKVVGLADPVVRTTNRRTRTIVASGTVWWDDDEQLEKLQNIPGMVYFREPQGSCVPVVVTVELSYPKDRPTTVASVSMTQIASQND